MTRESEGAVVLLSGGQDSTTAFHWARRYITQESGGRIAAVSFDYGQRHRIELDLAAETAKQYEVEHEVLTVEALKQLGAASLTNIRIGNAIERAERNVYADERGLPSSYVPGRNLLFFTLAAAWAAPRGFRSIVTGVCQQDRAGYPDCRQEFVVQMEAAIRIGFDMPSFVIYAPLLFKTKAQTWEMADQLGVLGEVVIGTHTCYEGDRSGAPKPWGYGCGECGACVERQRGYEEFRAGQLVA